MKKTAILEKDKYAIIKSKKPANGAFAIINDGKEITVITKQTKIKHEEYADMKRD